jgi:superfamily II DNA or RNA helicase
VKVNIVVDNRIRMPLDQLTADARAAIQAKFTHDNPKRAALIAMELPHWSEPAEIATWRVEGGHLTVPRGGMRLVRALLAERGVAWSAEDRRIAGVQADLGLTHSRELRPYQVRLRDAALAAENCILRAPTGSGKTSVGMALSAEFSRRGIRTLVVVSSGALHEQWIARARDELGVAKGDLGVIGAGKYRLATLTVAMQQTLAKRTDDPELLAHFGAVICDEVQLFAAPTFFAAVDPFPARYRIGISADHRRKDGKEFLIHDVFGAVAEEVSQDALIEQGHVLDVEVRVVPTAFSADWYGMPKDFHTGEPTGKVLDIDRLYNEMRADGAREALVMAAVVDEARAGNQVLAMSHRVEHCRQIDRACAAADVRTGLMLGGEENRLEFAATREGLEAGRVRAAAGTYQAIGYGIDLPSAGIVVCATPLASNRQNFGQARGRACRPSPGKEARLYYLWDREVFGLKHLQNLVAWNNLVRVWEGGKWVDGRAYLRAERAA